MDVSLDALYTALEPTLMPLIVDQAERWHRALGIDREDATQEARIALRMAMESYDYNRSRGGVRAFARQTIHNALCAMLYSATAQMRVPHMVATDEEGQHHLVRYPVGSLEAMEEATAFEPADAAPDAEARYIDAEMDERIKLLRLRLLMALSGRERDVFECQAFPSEAFMLYMRNANIGEPTIEAIGIYLGLSKNEVDWALHKAKRVFTSILEGSEFIDLIEGAIRDGKWPMIHHSGVVGDICFIQRVIVEHRLDPMPLRVSDVMVAGYKYRVIEHYSWGSIVHLHLDDERQATLVLEGRFNYRTGEVIGAGGHWKQLGDDVPWYSELNKALAPKRAKPANGDQDG